MRIIAIRTLSRIAPTSQAGIAEQSGADHEQIAIRPIPVLVACYERREFAIERSADVVVVVVVVWLARAESRVVRVGEGPAAG